MVSHSMASIRPTVGEPPSSRSNPFHKHGWQLAQVGLLALVQKEDVFDRVADAGERTAHSLLMDRGGPATGRAGGGSLLLGPCSERGSHPWGRLQA